MFPCVSLDTCFYIPFIVLKNFLINISLSFSLQFTIFALYWDRMQCDEPLVLQQRRPKSLSLPAALSFSLSYVFSKMFDCDWNGKLEVGCGGTLLPGLFGPLLENFSFTSRKAHTLHPPVLYLKQKVVYIKAHIGLPIIPILAEKRKTIMINFCQR